MAVIAKINFRSTAGHVTDESDEIAWLPTTGSYPTVVSPVSGSDVTAGWFGSVGGSDRTTGNVNLSGFNWSNTPNRYFTVDLPEAGEYEIRIAVGDPSAGGTTDRGFVLKDGATTIADVNADIAGGNLLDAAGNTHATADWPGNNVAVTHTFVGTTLVIEAASSLGDTSIVHLEINSVDPPDSITITTPKANQPYQRDETTDTVDVAVAGTYTDNTTSPTSIEYRFAGGSWATIDASPSGGTFSGTTAIAVGQGAFEVRFANSTGVTDSRALVTCGDIYVVAGQSNASGRTGTLDTYSHASLTALMYKQGETAWEELADPTDAQSTGSVWLRLASELMAADDVPVAFITTAVGGTNLITATADWKPTTTYGTTLQAALTDMGDAGVNGIKAILWDQGEGDAANTPNEAAELQAYSDLIDAFQTVPAAASAKLITVQVGAYSLAPADDLDKVRRAQRDAWRNDADIYQGPVSYTRGGTHWAYSEVPFWASLWFYAIQRVFESSTVAHPELESINTTGSTIELTFNSDLNTSDTTYPVALFAVDDSGAVTVNSATRNGARQVDVVCASALSAAATISFAAGNTGSNQTPPRGASTTTPFSTATSLPALPFYDVGEDDTPPAFSSGAVSASGTKTVLSFVEAGSVPLLPQYDATGFTLTASGGSLGIDQVVRTGDTEITLYHDRVVESGETVTVSYSAGNVTDSATNALATISAAGLTNSSTVVFPSAAFVIDTQTYGRTNSTAGTYHAALSSEVIDTASFGVSSGTSGLVHQPEAAEVVDTASFGVSSGTNGLFHAPEANEVIDTASFGVSSGTAGTYGTVLTTQVQSGVVFGPSDTLTGTLTVGGGTYPPTGKVIATETYGPNGNDFMGDYLEAGPEHVRKDVVFGPASGLLIGEVEVPAAASVLLGVLVDDGAGTYRPTTEAQTESGVVFGPGDSLTGTLTGGAVTVGPFNPTVGKTNKLELVQRADYTDGSLTGPLLIKIEQEGVFVGEVVRFGATLSGDNRMQVDGVVVEIDGVYYGSFQLTKETHTDRPGSEYWRWEMEHVSGVGVVSPLWFDQPMTLFCSHAES